MVRDASLTLFRVRGVPIRAHWTRALALPYARWRCRPSCGQAVNRRDEAAARRALEMIRRTCNRTPSDD